MAWRFSTLGGAVLARRELTAEDIRVEEAPREGAEFAVRVDRALVRLHAGCWETYCRCRQEHCWHLTAANEYRRLCEAVDEGRSRAAALERARREVEAAATLAEAEADVAEGLDEVKGDG